MRALAPFPLVLSKEQRLAVNTWWVFGLLIVAAVGLYTLITAALRHAVALLVVRFDSSWGC